MIYISAVKNLAADYAENFRGNISMLNFMPQQGGISLNMNKKCLQISKSVIKLSYIIGIGGKSRKANFKELPFSAGIEWREL